MSKLNRDDTKQVKSIKKHRRQALAKLAKDIYLLNRKNDFVAISNLVCDEFSSLGGVYVKFMQGVLLKTRFMKDWQSSDKLKIFENLDSEPLDIMAILNNELPANKLSQISGISPTPFAAGSFGQVYFATLTNGNQVIIKLLRPLIKETLAYDLKLIGIFSKAFVGKFSKNLDMDVQQAIDDFKRATLRETDYIGEAEFANELYQAYRDNPYLVIPKTYLELCTPNIIVQEYIGGVSGAQLLRFKEQGVDIAEYVKEHFNSDLDEQMKILGSEYIKGIFLLPRVQGDPHPGNVKLLDDNRVALIDFGIYANSPKEKAAFYGVMNQYQQMLDGRIDVPMMLGQFLRFFVSDLYKAMKKITTLLPEDDAKSNDLTRQMGVVAEDNFKQEMGDQDIETALRSGNILSTINRAINSGNRFGVVIKMNDSDMLRAAQSYVTLVDSFGLKGSVLPEAFDRGLKFVANERPDYTREEDINISVNKAMEIVSRWLERVANRDPALFKTFVNKIKKVEQQKKAHEQNHHSSSDTTK